MVRPNPQLLLFAANAAAGQRQQLAQFFLDDPGDDDLVGGSAGVIRDDQPVDAMTALTRLRRPLKKEPRLVERFSCVGLTQEVALSTHSVHYHT